MNLSEKQPSNDLESENDENPWFKIFRSQVKQNRFLPKNWSDKHFYKMERDEGSYLDKIIKILETRDLKDQVGIWINGKTGHGKTHLLISLFNSICWQYYHLNNGLNGNVKFWNYSDLCGVLRQNANDYEMLCKIRYIDFLFIDDLGTSKVTDFIQEKIYSIFNFRCENNLPTFVTTNLTIKDINEEFTERMGSRIKESAVWIELNGTKDYRSNIFLNNMKKYKEIIK